MSGSRPAELALPPLAGAAGQVRLPGSKSISNRALLLAGLAEGETVLEDLLAADDTAVMLAALRALGVAIDDGPPAIVRGAGGCFPVRAAELFLGNAGTALRPLTAALVVCGGEYRLSGTVRMHERPIGDLVDALARLGARIDYLGMPGCPPLAVRPSALALEAPVRVRGDVSSQFLTALLMALPLAGRTAVIEVEGELISRPYVEITLNLMRRFGVAVRRTAWRRFELPAACYRSPGRLRIEGDASAASYFLAAGALGGGPVRVQGVDRASIQGDIGFAAVLEAMGAHIAWGEGWVEASAAPGRLRAFDLDLNHIPDAAMTAAVLALFADGPCRIRNVASWRVKETDRLAAMATELRKLGATVQAGADFLAVTPPARLAPGAAIDTYDDHRMAMAFSLAAFGGVPVTIRDPDCVRKTYPDYFDAFAAVTGRA